VDGSRSRAREAQPVVALDGPAWTRALFVAWAERPLPTLGPWALGSLAIGVCLLVSALAVALLAGPSGPYTPVFADPSAGANDFARIVVANTSVLALQILVCVGAHLALRPGDHARRRAWSLYVIAGLSVYSLASQAWRLGHELASAAHTLGFTPAELLVRLSPHAVPELTAVFLPLAGCVSLLRRRRFEDLGAAALLTAVVAFPIVVCAAGIEVYLTPYVA
jgi:Stage II sporulation protein M